MPALLPIDEVIPNLVDLFRNATSLVLTAPPGAGKTTRVPPALVDSGLAGGSDRVLVLQPRRMAARSVARRMAEERNGRIGGEIGYQIRFDRQVGRDTRVIVMTEGVLVRMLQDDPFLEGVTAVVFDEFHERHLETDLGLAMCRRVQQTVRPDLKLLVMSATLDAAPIAKFLGQCPVLNCDVPRYPVHIAYAEFPAGTALSVQVARGVERMLDETQGDVLVFLPGVREIRQAQEDLRSLAERCGLKVLPLYGELSAEEQDRIFEQGNSRRIIISTNVAETSITIPGVTAVVDSGLARVMEFDPATGLNRLELKQISRASADQRAGRAGRTGPGVCLRLWPEASHRHRTEHELPELHRVDLSGVVLQLMNWGEADVSSFPWYEAPRSTAVTQAGELLQRLDAVDETGVTLLGSAMARLPISPRLARLLIAASEANELPRGALLAATLSERDPFQRADRRGMARHRSRSDLLDRVDALWEFRQSGRTQFAIGSLHRSAAEYLLRSARQLEQLGFALSKPNITRSEQNDSVRERIHGDDALLIALVAAFPDRVARRRDAGSRRGLMVGGRGVRLADESAVAEGELFLALDIDDGQGEAMVRAAAFVDRSWLPAKHLQTRIDLEFDRGEERIQARRRTYWLDLPLDESPASLPDAELVSKALAQEAAANWERIRPEENVELNSFLARVGALRGWMPDLNLPVFDDMFLQSLLPDLCLGIRSFGELRLAPWLDVIGSQLTPHQRQMLDREAPERIAVPSGSRLFIQYETGRPPILAVRIQEIFGWKKTPRIAGGRVPLLLHLLAPNNRPQQITDDLESFWKNGYPVVRGELRRRYPKHSWPDDPAAAIAERRPQRK